MDFAIVEFTDDKSVAVIATNWLKDNVCYWPSTSKSKAIEKLVKERAEPGSDWMRYPIRVLHKYGMFSLTFVMLCGVKDGETTYPKAEAFCQ